MGAGEVQLAPSFAVKELQIVLRDVAWPTPLKGASKGGASKQLISGAPNPSEDPDRSDAHSGRSFSVRSGLRARGGRKRARGDEQEG